MSVVTIKPIRTEADYKRTMARIAELWDVDRTPEETDEFDVLVVLAEAWEDLEIEWPSIPKNELRKGVLENLIEHRGLKPDDFAEACGGLSHVYEVLQGKRPLTDSAAQAIASSYQLDPSLFG